MYPLDRHIYLASRSARRRELLKQIGVSFEVLLLREGVGRAADFDETPLPGETPADYVLRVAKAKAEVGWARLSQRRLMRFPVLSADTTVALDGRILGKPADREQAMVLLKNPPAGMPVLEQRRIFDHLDDECRLHVERDPEYPLAFFGHGFDLAQQLAGLLFG